jgi:DNA polymerase III subunit epsilon
MLLLGLDFETTGFDFEKDRIIEIGAVLWDTEIAMPVRLLSALVRHADNPRISAEITRLTGIHQAMVEQHGVEPRKAFADLLEMAASATAVAAHNGSRLDQPMFEAELRRQDAPAPSLPWIDTCLDVPFPPHITTRKLAYLGAEHGFLNPFSHRAVFDVLTMFRILTAYPIAPILDSARQPIVMCVAQGMAERAEAPKKRGYRWRAATRRWTKALRQGQADWEKAEAGFAVEIVPFVATEE